MFTKSPISAEPPNQELAAYIQKVISLEQDSIGLASIENPYSPIIPSATCLVPCDEIVSGGPPPDGIPSIDAPKFLSITDSKLADDELVIGVTIDGIARAYPYDILNWHEIVNDEFNGKRYAITYCPLTASGILFNVSEIQDAELGTSGSLYQNNLVYYDRISGTYYSQMYGKGITGDNLGVDVKKAATIETTWKTWKQLYPDTEVLSRDTGYSRNYDSYPYGSYYTDNSIYFPTNYDNSKDLDSLYHPKEISLIVQDGFNAFVAPFSELAKSEVVNLQINNQATVIFSSIDDRLALAYKSEVDGEATTFKVTSSDNYNDKETLGFQVYLDDLSGTTWNVLGTAIDGTHKGESLEQIPTYNAFWFAVVAFFPNATLFTGGTVTQLSGTAPVGSFEGEVKTNRGALTGFSLVTILPSIVVLAILLLKKKESK